MKLSSFTERTNTAHFDIMDEGKNAKIDEIDVTYRPATWTPEFEERMQAREGGGDWSSAVFAQTLSEAITEWTLTEDVSEEVKDADGEVTTVEKTIPVPLTFERLKKLPTNLLAQIINGISDDMRPKKKPSLN